MEIEQLKSIYFKTLSNNLLKALTQQELKIPTHLFTTIFDQYYYELIISGYEKNQLHIEIGKKLLYPFENQLFINTQQAITIIPLFIIFSIGIQLDIHECIQIQTQQIWNIFLSGVAYSISELQELADEQYSLFLQNLEMKGNQFLAVDLNKTKKYLETFLNGKNLLKQTHQIFFEIYFQSVLQIQQNFNDYLLFKEHLCKQIILNIFSHIVTKQSEQIKMDNDYYIMQVAVSFLEKNYNYDYLRLNFDNLRAGSTIFNLIQLDHKQFKNFYISKTKETQDQLFQQILRSPVESNFKNLLLVGKCLSKLRHWEKALQIYEILQNYNNQNLLQQQYQYYITFKVIKIHFMQYRQLDNKTYKLSNLAEKIEQFDIEKPLSLNQSQNLYCQCLFLNFLICVYLNKTDKLKLLAIKIMKIIMISDSKNKKRPFTILQQELFRLINQHGIVFRSSEGERQIKFIINTFQSLCAERQSIESQKQGFFNFFNSTNQNVLTVQLNSYFANLEELLIINILVRFREINVLQYYNPKFYQVFKIILRQPKFFEDKQLVQINFFIHDFDQAEIYATKLKDYKILGQIYEYKGDYQKALEFYKKQQSPSTEFYSGIIHKINEQYSFAIDSFRKLENFQNQYKLICQMLKEDIWKTQNIVEVYKQKSISDFYSNSQNILSSAPSQRVSMKQPKEKLYLSNQRIFSVDFDENFENHIAITQFNNDYEGKQILNRNESQNEIIFDEEEINQLFPFQLRGDIKFFYTTFRQYVVKDNDQILKYLNEFVWKSQGFEIESNVLFADENYPTNKYDQGGQSTIYEFNYQGEAYVAKQIEFSYNVNQNKETSLINEEKKRFEQQLIEIIILLDLANNKIKNCLQLKFIGLRFMQESQNQRKNIIYLISKIYDKYDSINDWNDQDKIKYVFRLAKTLYILQSNGLAHLDLKPQNVLVDKESKSPVLIDFGISQRQFQSSISQDQTALSLVYADPDLYYRNYKSKKNDVYSFGMCLYQYFTKSYPFQGFDQLQIINLKEKFYEIHQERINKIQNSFIIELIKKCTKPIKDRINFFELYKELFFYIQKFKNEDVKQLLDLIFTHFIKKEQAEQQNQLNINLMRKFLKATNNFLPQQLQNQVENSFLSSYIKSLDEALPGIMQRMVQIVNWIMLNDLDNIVKLTKIQIFFLKIGSDQQCIEFKLFNEKCDKLSEDILKDWKLIFKTIIQTLQTIHERKICLLYIPLEKIFQSIDENKTIKIGSLAFSQNLQIENLKTYDLNPIVIDPQIQKEKKYNYSNDVYSFKQLIVTYQTNQIHLLSNQSQQSLNFFIEKITKIDKLQQILDILEE